MIVVHRDSKTICVKCKDKAEALLVSFNWRKKHGYVLREKIANTKPVYVWFLIPKNLQLVDSQHKDAKMELELGKYIIRDVSIQYDSGVYTGRCGNVAMVAFLCETACRVNKWRFKDTRALLLKEVKEIC